MIERRTLLAGGLSLLAACVGPIGKSSPQAQAELERIRATLGAGARLGVAAVDTGSGRTTGLDADALYAMASTFKMPLAAAVLVDAGRSGRSLDEQVRFTAADLVDYAPVVEANLSRGQLSVAELCAAIVEVSDNAAANLLLDRIGGPAGFTRFVRSCGDPITRLDRLEPALNSNLPGDPRDTTSPAAMLNLMRVLLTGEILPASSRTRLLGWMESSTTGRQRLRAGFPANWRAGDKTGTGANGATNDIAIAWPPGRAPLLIAAYQSGGTAAPAVRNAAHASIGRLVADSFA